MRIEETPKQRAETIAGLRAVAQFLEDRPEIPCPQGVGVQHSFIEQIDTTTWERIPSSDAEKIAFVRHVAELLGDKLQIYEGGVKMTYAVAARATYTVHATLRGEGGAA